MSVRLKNQASFLRIVPEKERALLEQFRNNILTSIIESETCQTDSDNKPQRRGCCRCPRKRNQLQNSCKKTCCSCLESPCCKKFQDFFSSVYNIVQSNVGLLLFLIIYACLGALLFSYLESAEDANKRNDLLLARRWFLTNMENTFHGKRNQLFSDGNKMEANLELALSDYNDTRIRLSTGDNETTWLVRQTDDMKVASTLLKQYEDYIGKLPVQITKYSTSSVMKEWSFFESLFFCGTVVTTIGYGNVTPVTKYGRIATMIYGCFGIPLCLIFLSKTGKNLTKVIKYFWNFIRRFYYTGSCKKVRRMNPLNKVKTEFVFKKLNEYLKNNGTKRKSQTWVVKSASDNNNQQMPLSFDVDLEKQQSQQKLQLISIQRQKSNDNNNQQQQQQQLLSDQQQQQQQQQQKKGICCFGNKDGKGDNKDDIDNEIVLPYAVDDNFNLPPIVALAIAFVYIFFGAFIYTRWENWDYLESFYFTFISLSTIGFGDVTPDHPKFFLASFVYILMGLSLIAMVINVIMEAVNATITKASVSVFNFRKKMRETIHEHPAEFKPERRMSV